MRQQSGEVYGPGGGSPEPTPWEFGAVGPPEMLVVAADRFTDAETVIAAVRGGRTVVLNAAGQPEAAAQRLVDFVCGAIAAMDGQVLPLSDGVFLLAPALARVEEDSPPGGAAGGVGEHSNLSG